MRILADENIPRAVVESLKANHNIVWARQQFPNRSDRELLELAELQKRILITLDQDFWNLAMQRPLPLKRSGIVLFRFHPALPSVLMEIVEKTLSARSDWVRHVSVVSEAGIEMWGFGETSD